MLMQTDGFYRYLNPAALAMYGAETAGQMVGQSIEDRVHPDGLAAVKERIQTLKEDRKTSPLVEERHLRMDGTAFDTEVTAIPFIFEGCDGCIVFVRDITERKREENKRGALEQQLRQAQKMEAVGRLAGGIAHDFNNVLMIIQSYAEMLQDRLPVQDSLRRNTEQVLKAADRGASLTKQLLAFGRKQLISPVVLDLNAVVSKAVNMLKRLIGEDIELQVKVAEVPWAVKADPDQIAQVLVNLCVNARDAMPQGGTLTIATSNVTMSEDILEKHPYVIPGNYVLLSVTDTGTGISKDLQEHIFEPFFTTKERGKGTGLGLPIVFGIVKQSGGYVWADSELGQGACFTIYLPMVEGAVAPNVSAEAGAPPRGTETLLVVEDEEFIREGICEFLRSLGYTVFAASSGRQALLIASEQEQIDLLLTDVVMPQMSGRELSQMLVSLRPGLKTIHMSGYTDDAVLRYGINELHTAFLQKPFGLGALARKVRETLGRAEPAR
jgi:two-component system cell cycle sensor histidine kinase/response regulator CckA